MANFYTDNPDLKHHLTHPLMEKIVALKERNYTDAEKYDYAPLNYEDAQDSYDKVLEIVGEICGDIIAPQRRERGPRRPLRGRRTCHLRPCHTGKPRRLPQGRPHGHGHAPPIRWPQLPHHPPTSWPPTL